MFTFFSHLKLALGRFRSHVRRLNVRRNVRVTLFQHDFFLFFSTYLLCFDMQCFTFAFCFTSTYLKSKPPYFSNLICIYTKHFVLLPKSWLHYYTKDTLDYYPKPQIILQEFTLFWKDTLHDCTQSLLSTVNLKYFPKSFCLITQSHFVLFRKSYFALLLKLCCIISHKMCNFEKQFALFLKTHFALFGKTLCY